MHRSPAASGEVQPPKPTPHFVGRDVDNETTSVVCAAGGSGHNPHEDSMILSWLIGSLHLLALPDAALTRSRSSSMLSTLSPR